MHTILTWDRSEKSSPIEGCIGDGLIGATLIGVECEGDSLMVISGPASSWIGLKKRRKCL